MVKLAYMLVKKNPTFLIECLQYFIYKTAEASIPLTNGKPMDEINLKKAVNLFKARRIASCAVRRLPAITPTRNRC